MKIKIVFVLFFLVDLFNAQISDQVRNLAKPLDTISHAESPHIGYGGEESKIYNHFKDLAKVAKNDELYYLAKNGSNALKVYSAKELFKRNDKSFLELYTYYSENPLMMVYKMGCTGSRQNIADFLKDEVYSAREIIEMRDELLNDNDGLSKATLEDIIEKGYHRLTIKEVKFYLNEIEKIDSNLNKTKLK